MVITRSQARQQALNRPPSVSDFQGRGSDLPIAQENEGDENSIAPIHPAVGSRTRGAERVKGVGSRKSLLFNWTPDTLPRRLRRNTVGGREGEKVFPSKRRPSTSSSHRTDSKERSKSVVEGMQQPTPKFGKEMTQFPGTDKIRRTPPPSPKTTPKPHGRSPSPAVSEEIVQTIEVGSTQGASSIWADDSNSQKMVITPATQSTAPPLWYDRGGLLRAHLPAVSRQGQIGRPLVSQEERERQEWLRWISWIWEARRRGVENQLPQIIRNARDNLDPSIREYDIELSRLIFRAITAEALKRLPTGEEMLYGIREGFIVALQLKDTTFYATKVRDLHDKGPEALKERSKWNVIRSDLREFSLEQVVAPDEPPSKELNQLSLEQNTALPRRSRYFTPKQSEAESEISVKQKTALQVAQALMPRDIPKIEQRLEEQPKINIAAVKRLTKGALEGQEKKRINATSAVGRSNDPSPSPSSSSTSADERRRRARRERKKEKDKKKKKKDLSKRRKKGSETEDNNPPDGSSDPSSSDSSSDSDVGNKKTNKKEDSSSEDSDRSERATRQQRKDFMAILKANAPKKYRGDRDPKV